MRYLKIAALAFTALAGLSGAASAADPAACETIRLSDPGWTDITSTNSVASVLLEGLGYKPDVKTMSVPIGYEALKTGNLDVFLGNWMPAQQKFRDDLDKAKAAEVIVKNLEGAKFTLAVPDYVASEGVKDFADLAAHADKFGKEIYGIEPGAPANQNIQKIIEDQKFKLDGWKLVESSEQAMLAQVDRKNKDKAWVVFLAWAPHPMNNKLNIEYLAGGDDYFGPNFGGAEVYTLGRTGWAAQCPNAATFFKNLTFTVDIENELMGKILDEGAEGPAAAKEWLKAHPDQIDKWLAGVTTFKGEPGAEAVKASLGL
ncbi:choline ABC transporter substrate-binding protein [Ochrobactrum pecoris]|uniref:Choline ABC transporter substrate-binding protein n=1 Tax=Brucella pecoris TaxID=867683 RepID=A0A5C5CJE2_9HYPH|nr:choline ABC transporter substrate-binding protein [Brucella pecoris]MBB4091581.1 glycine betaine/proline transport system substrate-binding protein [Brucella pecoris]NKW82524.1 choline ABC transporter substrate-binding protein [Brucella pecoris]TNV11672.1 choline ABC transporter substrate-binding protein [Brucella pecoris]